MRHKEIKDFVFASILVALIIMLTFTMLGFINIGGFAAFTIIHIPVLVGSIVLGKKYGLLLGTIFGICSMIMAFMTLGVNAPFTNPLLSVLPRSFFGWIIFPLYQLSEKIVHKKSVSIIITMVIGTLIHSLIVIFMLYIIGLTGFYFTASENPFTNNESVLEIFATIFSINSAIEILLAAIIGTPLVLVLDTLINKTKS